MKEKKDKLNHKIGVYVCHCGGNISDYVNVDKVKEEMEKEDGVIVSKAPMFACSDATQQEMIDDVKANNYDSFVVASCSPKLHLNTFREVAKRAGMNPYNYVQVNIREQDSWAHSDRPDEATEKAIKLVRSGVARVRYSRPLERIKIQTVNAVAVIGAGASGLRSAIELADLGSQVYIIEKEHFIGGRIPQWGELFPTYETGEGIIGNLYNEVKKRQDKITLFTGAEITAISGSVGDFTAEIQITPRYIKKECSKEQFDKAVDICPVEVDNEYDFGLTKRKAIYKTYDKAYPSKPAIDMKACTKCGDCVNICKDAIDLEQKTETLNINVGAVIVNTGFDPYEPKDGEFGYKTIDNVITLPQLLRLAQLNDKKLIYKNKEIKSIAYIYCVGSRQVDGENKYCSRYCCTSTIFTSIDLHKKFSGIQSYHINKGIRTYGKQEIIYEQSSQQGDIYLQFIDTQPPVVEKTNGQSTVKLKDILTDGEEIEVAADLIVLVTGMVPRENKKLIEVLKIPTGRDKFFNEIHNKLRPVETVIDGIFIAGASQAPKNIRHSLMSSLAASGKADALIGSGELELEPLVAVVDEDKCEWCDKCSEVCPYDAISKMELKDGKFVAHINEALCKGCGTCTTVCPEDALDIVGFSNNEIETMIDSFLVEEEV